MVTRRIKSRVLDYVLDNPGESEEAIAKALNLAVEEVKEALEKLEKENMVWRVEY